MKIKLKGAILLVACAAPLFASAASAQKFAKVEEFLDTDGEQLLVANPSHLKKQLNRDIDLVGKLIKKETSGESRVAAMSVYNGLRQGCQALGLGRVGCYGSSSKRLETDGSPARYLMKDRVLIGAADKPDVIGAFSGGYLDADELVAMPESCEVAFHAYLDASVLYAALQRISSFEVMAKGSIEPWLEENAECTAAELLPEIRGRFSLYHGRHWIKVSLPDPRGGVFSMLMKQRDDWELTEHGMKSASLFLNVEDNGRLAIMLADDPEECGEMVKCPAVEEVFKQEGTPERCSLFFVMSDEFEPLSESERNSWGTVTVYPDRVDAVSSIGKPSPTLTAWVQEFATGLVTWEIFKNGVDDEAEVQPEEEE